MRFFLSLLYSKVHVNSAHNPDAPFAEDSGIKMREKCVLCPASFHSQIALYTHVTEFHPSPKMEDPLPETCQHCQVQFLTKYGLFKHVMKYHSAEDGTTPTPPENYSKMLDYGQYTFGCPHCNQYFKTQGSRTMHVNKRHRPRVMQPREIRPNCIVQAGLSGQEPVPEARDPGSTSLGVIQASLNSQQLKIVVNNSPVSTTVGVQGPSSNSQYIGNPGVIQANHLRFFLPDVTSLGGVSSAFLDPHCPENISVDFGESESFNCNLCSQSFTSKDLIWEHLKLHAMFPGAELVGDEVESGLSKVVVLSGINSASSQSLVKVKVEPLEDGTSSDICFERYPIKTELPETNVSRDDYILPDFGDDL